ncbi:MAG: hypothetical protein IKJ99_00045 [Oscillospiraceae bacterium]|nr:hypothetical protein [Oscillospiraceae bacterium]
MKKTELWRLIVGLLSVGLIIYMWVRKGIGDLWTQLPPEELLPMALTSIAVTAVKVLLITAGILFIRWILSKITKR